ncbi:HAMP domain-containing protein [bacterium]|nr:HAMP domain-containing protein [bacterium]
MEIKFPIVVRLALWNTAVLLMALLLFGYLSYYFVSRELYSEQKTLLQESGEQVSEIMRIRDGSLYIRHLKYELREELNFTEKGIFFEITDRRGETVFRSPNFPYHLEIKDKIPEDRLGRFYDRQGSAFNIVSIPVSIRSRHHDHGRVYVYSICIGQSTKYVAQVLKRIRHLLFWLIPIVLLLSGTGGWYMAKRSLTPVAKITKTAKEIELQNLDKRLPAPRVDDELGRLTTTFNDMIDRLEKGVNKIQQFTADASHELRTPLTIIRGEIEVTLRRTRTNREYKEKLNDILSEILWMNKIVENLLTFSKADSDKNFLELKSTRPDKLVKEVVDAFKSAAYTKGITVEYKSGRGIDNIFIDRDRIRQVVSNLIDNAIKYTGKDGNVEVLLSKHEKGMAIAVSDTGIGIKKEDLPFVFDRFFRTDKSRTRFGSSTGLGLSICKLIVEAHNGNITIQSKPGTGTTVQVFLPHNPSEV